MASRRMKIKVMANVGRGPNISGANANRNPPGLQQLPIDIDTPTGPEIVDTIPKSPGKKYPLRDKTPEPKSPKSGSPRRRSKSPTKSPSPKVTSPRRSISPTKHPPPPSSPGTTTRSRTKSPNSDDDVRCPKTVIQVLVPVTPSPLKTASLIPTTTGYESPSKTKASTSRSSSERELPLSPKASPSTPTRGPGIGPPLTPCRNTMVLHSVQKEIGGSGTSGSGVGVSITSNETLRQRLQHSTLTTTKYATLRKEFMSKYKHNEKPEKKDLTILHFTFWNPPKGSDDKEDFISEGQGSSTPRRTESMDEESDFANSNTANETEEKKSVGPRVKVGPDGEIIIDEQSLVIETTASQRAKKQLEDMETVVGMSGMYRNKKSRRGFDWSTKETIRFYRALTYCGTDFSMMKNYMFPKRTRAELKAKFKREDRKNTQLISQALSCQTFDPTYVPTDEESDEEPIEEIDLRDEEGTKRKKIEFNKTCPSVEKHVAIRPTKTELPTGSVSGTKRRKSMDKCKPLQSQQVPGPVVKLKRGRQRKLGQESLPFDTRETEEEDIMVNESLLDQAVPASKVTKPKKSKSKSQLVTSPPPPIPPSGLMPKLKLPPKKDHNRRPRQPKKCIPEENSDSVPEALSMTSAISPLKKSHNSNEQARHSRKNPNPKRHQNLRKSVETPEVLKFDPTDILGLKIVSPSKTGRMIMDVPNDKEKTQQVSEISISSSQKRQKTSNIKSNTKGKAPPFRVPGPGLRHTESSTYVAPVFEDIEIEIS